MQVRRGTSLFSLILILGLGCKPKDAAQSARPFPSAAEQIKAELASSLTKTAPESELRRLNEADLKRQLSNQIVLVEQSAFRPSSKGIGVILSVSEDTQSPTGRMARILTSRYLIDPLHPVAGALEHPKGDDRFKVSVCWPVTGTIVTGTVNWLSPCEDQDNPTYLMDAAILSVAIPKKEDPRAMSYSPVSRNEPQVSIVTTKDGKSLVASSGEIKVRPESLSDHAFFTHTIDNFTYLLLGGDAVPLGSPVVDGFGRLIGIVDAANLIRAHQRLELLKGVFEKHDAAVKAKFGELEQKMEAYHKELSEKVNSLNEPHGVAFLVKKAIHAVFGEEDSGVAGKVAPGSFTIGSKTGSVAAEYFKRTRQWEAITMLGKACKSPGAETLIRSSQNWQKILSVIGVVDAAGDIWRDIEVQKRFTEAGKKRLEEIADTHQKYLEEIVPITLDLARLWSRIFEEQLKETPCSMTAASTLIADIMPRVHYDSDLGLTFSLPSSEWTCMKAEIGGYDVSRKTLHGKLRIHPESRSGKRWDLVGLGATWLHSERLPATTFDPAHPKGLDGWRNHAGYWTFSHAGERHLVAVFENRGKGYMMDFRWPAGEIQEAEVLSFLKDFRFDCAAPDVDKRTKEALLQQAVKAMQTFQLEEALEAYRYAICLEPENAEALNGLAWFLCINDSQSTSLSTIAYPYALKLQKMNPSAPHILDTLAWCHFLNGNPARAIEIERGVRQQQPYVHAYSWSLEQFEKLNQQSAGKGVLPSPSEIETVRRAASAKQRLEMQCPVSVVSWNSDIGLSGYVLEQELLVVNRTDRKIKATVTVEVLNPNGDVVLADSDAVELSPYQERKVDWIQVDAEFSKRDQYHRCRARVVKLE